jgi:ribosomal protein S18 acetylase RimI-like enzyme
MIEFIQAETPAQIDVARSLFLEYADWLGLSLCFQNFEQELAGLPGRYSLPGGRLWLVTAEGGLAGCVAMRKIDEGVCEMKRLYVRPGFRGRGIGRLMTTRLIGEARSIGYEKMRLDTLPLQMSEAVKLYRAIGFREIEPYYDNPVEGALFMELSL